MNEAIDGQEPLAGIGAARLAERRARVMERIGERAAMILPAAPEIIVGRDQELRYRPDAEFFYLTGYREPRAVAVLAPGAEAAYTLFVRPRDPDAERWSGVRGGPEAAVALHGADAAYPVDELFDRLPRLLEGVDVVYAPLAGDAIFRGMLDTVLAGVRRRRQRTGRGPRTLIEPGAILDEMRLRKDAEELELMRRAGEITVAGFRAAAARIGPGRGEWEVEAALEHEFRSRGGEGPAFASIVGAGENATVLHYIENSRRMREGELVLIDAGASWAGYAADVSRTFPVSGRFSPAQRAFYEIVSAAHEAACAVVRPGTEVGAVHRAALDVLVDGLIELGLLEGPRDRILEEHAYRAFFPHQTSHWLGLDVHDVGDYALADGPRFLEPGMVLTVEPGLYVPAAAESAPAELRGLGVRVEDTLAVTEDGHECLTPGLPTAAAEVEALLAGG